MTNIKAYTDVEQSKKLAEILPIESADMYWYLATKGNPKAMFNEEYNEYGDFELPCWSLTALLGVLPLVNFTTPQLIGTPKTLYRCIYSDNLKSHAYDNAVDSCYEMILKLNELNLL